MKARHPGGTSNAPKAQPEGLTDALRQRHFDVWALTVAAAAGGAWANQVLSTANNGRLTFMLLYPAVIFAGYLGGPWPAMAAAAIGATALVLWHPEMTDGRTLDELSAVGLFLLICALVARVSNALHRAEQLACSSDHPAPELVRPRGGPFPLAVVWPISLLGLLVALAINPEIDAYSSGRLPFAVFLPVISLAGYMGGFLPAFVVTVLGVGSVWVWHRHVGGVTGGPFYVLTAVYLFVGAAVGILAEALVRERRRSAAGAAALRDLPEAQARFAAIAQTSPDALWIWDMNRRRLVFISRASEKLTGTTPDQACAESAEETWEKIHPEDQPTVDEAIRTLGGARSGQTIEYEYRHRHRDGSWRWLRNRAGVFSRNPDGSVGQIFGHTEDVTDRHESTDRLAAQAAELARIAIEREATLREREALLEAERAARAEAERANRLKDDFLATVSHELRTPLTAMLGWTAMLSEDARDPELRKGLDVITRNARAQRQLIEDLLDMSRIMTGKLRIEPRPVLLSEIVSTAMETVRPAAEARGVALVSEIEGCEEPIQADVDRLQQVIWNLLSNAVKFTPAGGQVRVRAVCTPGEAIIAVADTGQGMAPEFVPHVFERFRQEDGATTRKTGGLGLGLAIVKHLVELHGGTVRAESEGLGKGSVFTISLPLQPQRSGTLFRPHEPAPAAAVAQAAPDALAGRRILIIDDESDTRSYLHRVLSDRGAHVAVAENAAQGLRRAVEEKPEAIVCDISMPGEDGYSFIRRLRRSDDRDASAIPAAALTALARSEDRQRALEAGFDEHCAKPVEPAELLALLARLLPR